MQRSGKSDIPMSVNEGGKSYSVTVRENSLYIVNEDLLNKAKNEKLNRGVIGVSIVWNGDANMQLFVHRYGVDKPENLSVVKTVDGKFSSKLGGLIKKQATRFIPVVNES